MNAISINTLVRCEECTFADAYGNSCKHGLIFPVMVWMMGQECPNFKYKTSEQLEYQSKVRKEAADETR